MTPQLKLFEPHFDQRIRHVEMGGVMFFSVLDIFKHYGSEGSASNPTMYWKRAEKRLEEDNPGTLLLILSHQFPGRRQRPTPIATVEVIETVLGTLSLSLLAPACYVYVLAYKEDRTFVKIGKAVDLEARLRHYKMHTTPALTPIYLFSLRSPSASQIERTLHQRYAAVRVRGEWFALTPELLQEAIAYAHSLVGGAS